MNCPGCGFEYPADMKFCGQCGAKLAAICSSCNFENAPGMKFCGQCGAQIQTIAPSQPPPPSETAPLSQSGDRSRLEHLQSYIPKEMSEKILRARDEIEGERRNVTVLFSDISGFTSLSEKLDPEEVYGTMNDCFKELVEIIYKYEGVVDKFIGDAIMALFGAPLAHEDDPERAVRTALEMQDKISELSQAIEKRVGFPIQMRVGINSGEVVAGAVGSDLKMDYTVMGDTVNLASRLEGAATVGSVLISGNTYAFVQHVFDIKPLAPITVKGKSEPIKVFEVKKLKRLREEYRGIKTKTPLVGRAEEMSTLKSKVDEMNENPGSIVAIVGEAGLGKSRLAEELVGYAKKKKFTVLEGRCLSYQTSISYGLFQDALSRYFGFSLQDPDEEIEKKIAYSISKESKLEKSLPFFSFLFSLETEATKKLQQINAEQIKNQTISAIIDLVSRIASSSPVLIVLDDLQWIDSISSDVIEALAKSISGKKVVISLISRPTDDEKTSLIERIENLKLAHFTKIEPLPLTDAEVRSLFRSLSNVKDVNKEIRESILPKAGGNPLYLEELFRAMVEEKILKRERGKWILDESVPMADSKISPTIQGLMMSRVDRLAEEDKKTIQCASVIGKSFTLPILLSIENGGKPALEERLDNLEKSGFIEMTGRGPKEVEYSFVHILIQETVYKSLLMKKRLSLHSRVAEAIEKIYPKKLNEMVDLLAYHYSQSENTDKAIDYCIKAGNKAASTFANQVGIDYYNKALSLLQDRDQPVNERLALEGLAQIMFVIGNYEESVDKYREAISLSSDDEDFVSIKANILEKIGKSESYIGKFLEATESLEESLKISGSSDGAEIEKARALSTLGWVKYNLGKYEEALRACLKASEILEESDRLRDMASNLNTTGAIYYDQGNWDLAVDFYSKSLDLVEKIGDQAGISACHTNLGLILCDQNKLEEAFDHHKKSLGIEQKMGNVYGIALSLNNMGIVHLTTGKWAKAKRYFKRALEIYQGTGANDFLPEIILYLAEIEIYNANFSLAKKHCEKALDLAFELNSKFYEARAYRIFGTIGRYNRDFKNAKENLDKSLEIFRSLDIDLEIGRTLLERSILLRRQAQDGHGNGQDFAAAAKEDLLEIQNIFERLNIERELKIAAEEMLEIQNLLG